MEAPVQCTRSGSTGTRFASKLFKLLNIRHSSTRSWSWFLARASHSASRTSTWRRTKNCRPSFAGPTSFSPFCLLLKCCSSGWHWDFFTISLRFGRHWTLSSSWYHWSVLDSTIRPICQHSVHSARWERWDLFGQFLDGRAWRWSHSYQNWCLVYSAHFSTKFKTSFKKLRLQKLCSLLNYWLTANVGYYVSCYNIQHFCIIECIIPLRP